MVDSVFIYTVPRERRATNSDPVTHALFYFGRRFSVEQGNSLFSLRERYCISEACILQHNKRGRAATDYQSLSTVDASLRTYCLCSAHHGVVTFQAKEAKDNRMSHTVTVTRTTTTATTTALLLNTGFFKTVPGLLKLFETLLGAVCVGLVANYHQDYRYLSNDIDIFFLLITTTFMIATFIILLSSVLSINTAALLPKTLFELIYHGIAFALYVSAAIALSVHTSRYRQYRYEYEPFLAASIIGLINATLYLISTVFSYRSYRGG